MCVLSCHIFHFLGFFVASSIEIIYLDRAIVQMYKIHAIYLNKAIVQMYVFHTCYKS